MNNKKLNYKTILLVILAMAASFAYIQSLSTPFSFIEEGIYHLQPYDLKGFIKGGIYFGTYLASLLGIVLAIFTRNKIIATGLIVFIGLAYGIDLFTQLVGSNDKGISIGTFSLAMIERSRAGDMMLFRTQLIQASMFALAIILGALIIRLFVLKSFRINSWLSVGGIVAISIAVLGAVIAIFSIVGQSFPAPIKTLAIASEYFIEEHNDKPRVLRKSIQPTDLAKYKTIVWLIDESVGGQYLSVNGYKKDTTPYLKKISKTSPDFFNYGVVPSVSNCSASSNLFLRIGMTSAFPTNEIRSNKKSLPTIFQYADRAGFETYLIDAQVAKGQIQNFLSVSDKLEIDNYITYSRKYLPNQRDRQVLKTLKNILSKKDSKKRFIVVVKWGSHWPYPLTYKKEIFKPAAKESFIEMKPENKTLIMNAYYNSLRFGSDGFLFQLTHNMKLNDKIIFYTSDHGQNLYKDKNPLTHCHEGKGMPPMDDYKVPLMVFSKDIKNKLRKPIHNIVAQEQLIPTTLELMGYPEKIKEIYGPDLSDGISPQKFQVNVGNTGRRVPYTPAIAHLNKSGVTQANLMRNTKAQTK